MSEELTQAILHLINAASWLPIGQPKVVNLSMPRGSGKTTAILNLLTKDDMLVVSGARHYREIVKLNTIKSPSYQSFLQGDAPYREEGIRGTTSVLHRVTVLAAATKNYDTEAKVDWGLGYKGYKKSFATTKTIVELQCLSGLPREALMGRKWKPRIVFIDEPNIVLGGRDHRLMEDAIYSLVDRGGPTIIVGVGT